MVMTDERGAQDLWISGVDTFNEDNPPSLDEIMSLKADYQPYYQEFHDNCGLVDDYYYRRHTEPVPEGHKQITTSKAYSIIETAVNHVDVNNVSIIVPLSSPRAKARAEKLQKFYQGTWANIKMPVKRDVTRHAFAYGIGFFKTMWRTDQWPDAPRLDDYENDEDYKEALDEFMDRRGISFPISVEQVNPQRLIWDDSKLGAHWFIEFYERHDADDLKHRFPEWSGHTERNGVINWVEYWDDKWVVYIANNEVVWSSAHGYGFVNYIPVYPANTMNSNDGLPHERYQGLLNPIFSLLDEHQRVVNAISAMVRSVAWRTLDFGSGPGRATTQEIEEVKSNYEIFGGMNTVGKVEVKPSPMVVLPPDLFSQRDNLETQIEESTFPNVIRGMRPKGVSSGFQVSVLAGMGRLVFQGVADGMARAIEQCNTNFARLIENKVQGKLTIHARTEIHNFDQAIGPEDVKGYYENMASLKAEAPEEREREAILAQRLWNNGEGIISLYEAQRRSGVLSPLEMQLDQQAERSLRSPTIQAFIEQQVAERVGLLQQLVGQVPGQAPAMGGVNQGQFAPGLSQLQRPGETNIQGARVAAQTASQSVFPDNFGGIDSLGSILGTPNGGAQAQPNGEIVR